MLLMKNYVMREQLMWLAGCYDRIGNVYSIITETERTFIVAKSPLELIEFNINCIGYELSGARKAAKNLLGDSYLHPILINPLIRLVLFPSRSIFHIDNCWFNPNHIIRTTSRKNDTNILFSNKQSIHYPSKLSAFNNRITKAEQLENLTSDPSIHLDNLD